MGIKKAIKQIIALTREKTIIPIQHPIDSNKLLDGKVALITGGSGGIGFSIAKTFAESGCKVIIAGTNEKKLTEMLKTLNKDLQSGVRPIVLNVEDINLFDEKIKEASRFYGKIDILVSSAGVHTDNVDFWNMTDKEYNRVLDVNLKGTFFICQSFGKYLRDNKLKGHILLVSSSRGSEPAWSPYGISKWAINGLTKGLAEMLLPYGIIVNGIAPGSTATELLGVKEGDSIYTTENRVGRYAMPDEIAAYAKLMVSDLGDMVIGETVHISGGRGTIDIR